VVEYQVDGEIKHVLIISF